ncbi:MAG: putative secreted protein [Candidatus Phytoplasma cynodontis]|uniref:hypothetical protein n=1 Tax='Cynodon dactylon' phytoplasma TaxID=295320 RepID=UPI001265CECB|nr:hypothetical protein ['Cynodon dactylon' phytoplasma]KAB8121726.1 hypothetical protein F1741_01990 ['Cynodon dactylon' phytoplasma]WIA07690.1 MAG: putative secreted protein [Candidatus Phytoplasma cynodontis]
MFLANIVLFPDKEQEMKEIKDQILNYINSLSLEIFFSWFSKEFLLKSQDKLYKRDYGDDDYNFINDWNWVFYKCCFLFNFCLFEYYRPSSFYRNELFLNFLYIQSVGIITNSILKEIMIN